MLPGLHPAAEDAEKGVALSRCRGPVKCVCYATDSKRKGTPGFLIVHIHSAQASWKQALTPNHIHETKSSYVKSREKSFLKTALPCSPAGIEGNIVLTGCLVLALC